MKNDLLANRHIGICPAEEKQMLQQIGVGSLDELIDKTIPANIRLQKPLDLPEAMTEYQFSQHIAALAAKNKLFTSYIGQGWYGTITPAVIQRNVKLSEAPSYGLPAILYDADSNGAKNHMALAKELISRNEGKE